MDRVRTFVAVRLPERARRRLALLTARLMRCGADVKWVSEENFHITLKFIGPIEPERVEAAASAVRSAVEGMSPFPVRLAGLGAFPKTSRPGVVWAGVRAGADELRALATGIEAGAERCGFRREERAFSPHVTLGRARSSRGSERLCAAIEALRNEEVDAFTVASVAVMRSDLSPSGPAYSVLFEFDLKGADQERRKYLGER